MSTSVVGINEEHENLAWYKHLDVDSKRVNHLFEEAGKKGWEISEVITTSELIRVLQVQNKSESIESERKSVAAIVLVNNNTLQGWSDTSYSGHYIFAIGYDDSSKAILYLDPALGSQIQRVSEEVLDDSRQTPGTDHDLILITRREEQSKNE